MYAEDLLVLIYPNLKNIESVIIVDPFDKKIELHPVSSIEEVKEVLRNSLPFCFQDDEPEIHIGSAHVLEWDKLPSSNLRIKVPHDVEKVLS